MVDDDCHEKEDDSLKDGMTEGATGSCHECVMTKVISDLLEGFHDQDHGLTESCSNGSIAIMDSSSQDLRDVEVIDTSSGAHIGRC